VAHVTTLLHQLLEDLEDGNTMLRVLQELQTQDPVVVVVASTTRPHQVMALPEAVAPV
jgi:hypothetical protein